MKMNHALHRETRIMPASHLFCPGCLSWRVYAEFGQTDETTTGRRARCRDCEKRARVKREQRKAAASPAARPFTTGANQ